MISPGVADTRHPRWRYATPLSRWCCFGVIVHNTTHTMFEGVCVWLYECIICDCFYSRLPESLKIECWPWAFSCEPPCSVYVTGSTLPPRHPPSRPSAGRFPHTRLVQLKVSSWWNIFLLLLLVQWSDWDSFDCKGHFVNKDQFILDMKRSSFLGWFQL